MNKRITVAEDPSDNSLSFVTTEDMVEELRRRSDTLAVFMRPKSAGGEGFDWSAFYGGDFDRVLGLIEMGKWDLLRRAWPDGDPGQKHPNGPIVEG